MDVHNNEKGQDLDKFQDKDGKYISLLFFLQKESNCLTNLSKGTRSLNYLIYILKLLYQVITNFALEFPGKKSLKTKKKSILAACKRR